MLHGDDSWDQYDMAPNDRFSFSNPYRDQFGRGLDPEYPYDRARAIESFGYAIPTSEAIDAIAAAAPLIEIGAGTGYWGMLLSAQDVEYRGFDRRVRKHAHAEIQEGGPEMIEDYPDHALLLLWPPNDSPMAATCLERTESDTVFYAGPRELTADDRFYELRDADWRLTANYVLPHWEGFDYDLERWERR